MSSEHNLNEWNTRMAAGRMAYEAGFYTQAAHHFRLALQIVDTSSLPAIIKPRALVNLGKTLSCLGQNTEAELLIKQAIDQDESSDDCTVELIEDYHQLSLFYWRTGNLALAQTSAQRALDSLQGREDVPDELTAKLLKHMAVLSGESGDYRASEQWLDRAIDFIENSDQLSRQSLIYGDCLLVKTLLLAEQKQYEAAAETYMRAMQIEEIGRGLHHPKVEDLLKTLGKFDCQSDHEKLLAKFRSIDSQSNGRKNRGVTWKE